MNPAPRNKSLIVAACSIAVALFITTFTHLSPDSFLHDLELDSYDWRARQAASWSAPPAPELAAVYLDDNTITNLSSNHQLDFPYPRWVHGRVIRELQARGAETVAFDILFNDRRNDVGSPHADVKSQKVEPSDEFMGRQLKETGIVILAAGKGKFTCTIVQNQRLGGRTHCCL